MYLQHALDLLLGYSLVPTSLIKRSRFETAETEQQQEPPLQLSKVGGQLSTIWWREEISTLFLWTGLGIFWIWGLRQERLNFGAKSRFGGGGGGMVEGERKHFVRLMIPENSLFQTHLNNSPTTIFKPLESKLSSSPDEVFEIRKVDPLWKVEKLNGQSCPAPPIYKTLIAQVNVKICKCQSFTGRADENR